MRKNFRWKKKPYTNKLFYDPNDARCTEFPRYRYCVHSYSYIFYSLHRVRRLNGFPFAPQSRRIRVRGFRLRLVRASRSRVFHSTYNIIVIVSGRKTRKTPVKCYTTVPTTFENKLVDRFRSRLRNLSPGHGQQ